MNEFNNKYAHEEVDGTVTADEVSVSTTPDLPDFTTTSPKMTQTLNNQK